MRSALRGPAHQLAVPVRMRINIHGHNNYCPINQPCTAHAPATALAPRVCTLVPFIINYILCSFFCRFPGHRKLHHYLYISPRVRQQYLTCTLNIVYVHVHSIVLHVCHSCIHSPYHACHTLTSTDSAAQSTRLLSDFRCRFRAGGHWTDHLRMVMRATLSSHGW